MTLGVYRYIKRNWTFKAVLLIILFSLSLNILFGEELDGAGQADSLEQEEAVGTIDLLPQKTQAFSHEDIPTSYELIIQNQNYKLFADKSSGSFVVQCIRSNAVWWSNPVDSDSDILARGAKKNEIKSLIHIDTIDPDRNKKTKLLSYTKSVKDGNAKFERTDKGFRITYDFPDEKISVPVEYALETDRLKAWIDVDSIKEEGKELIYAISLLPYMAAPDSYAKGYMFVPDGAGSLINLNNGKTNYIPYSKKLYDANKALYQYMKSYNTEPSIIPVYGIKEDDKALLAVVTDGAADGTINADISSRFTSYNNVYCTFALRYSDIFAYENERKSDIDIYYSGNLGVEKCQVEFFFIHKPGVNYVDMASIYRQYLMKDLGITKQEELPNYMYVTLYGAAVKKEPFLGIPVEKIQSLCTFEQASTILQESTQAGIKNMVIRYNNWSAEGIWSKIAKSEKPEKKLGGIKKFKGLQEAVSVNNAEMYLGVELLNIKRGGLLSDFFDFAKTIQGVPISVYSYKPNTYVRDLSRKKSNLLTAGKIKEITKKNISSLKKINTGNVALNDLCKLIYSDFKLDRPGMSQTFNYSKEAISQYKNTFDNVMLDGGTGETFGYARHIVSLPVEGSSFDLVDEDIPFVQIVLHGITSYSVPPINLSPNPDKMFLKAVETGSRLHYTWIANTPASIKDTDLDMLFGANYREWLSTASSQFQTMEDLNHYIDGRFIKGHEKLQNGVFKTIYEDDLYTIVNYNEESVQINGNNVKGMGFIIGKEGE